MPPDLVVDTNVFMHADNPTQKLQQASLNFVVSLIRGEACVCVDDGFDINESQNRSLIGHEYIKYLLPGTASFQAIIFLAKNGRIKIVPKSVAANVAKVINQSVFDQTDRVFVRVTVNSDDRLLLSHDSAAMPGHARNRLKRELNVTVICADELE